MSDAGAIVALGVIGYYFQNKYKEEMMNNMFSCMQLHS